MLHPGSTDTHENGHKGRAQYSQKKELHGNTSGGNFCCIIAQNTENEKPARAPNRAGLLLKQKRKLSLNSDYDVGTGTGSLAHRAKGFRTHANMHIAADLAL